jgi:hypothetical protein
MSPSADCGHMKASPGAESKTSIYFFYHPRIPITMNAIPRKFSCAVLLAAALFRFLPSSFADQNLVGNVTITIEPKGLRLEY